MAVKPSDAVKSYLGALAAGDAQTALSFGETIPTDASLLTGAVLAQSNKLAPITDINVPDVNDEYAYKVDASYRLGKQEVNESFTVEKAGDRWKLRETYTELDLSTRQEKTVPMIINGVTAKAGTVRLFPGAYQFTTGSSYLTWGEEPVLLIQGPSDYPRGVAGIRPTLTAEGEKAFSDAVIDSVKRCLKLEELSNPGCPNNMTRLSGTSTYKLKKGTLEWEATDKESLDNLEPRLDSSNPAFAEAIVSLGFRAAGRCNAPGGTCTLTQFGTPNPKADVVQKSLRVIWGR